MDKGSEPQSELTLSESKLSIAIWGGAIAIAGNALVAIINGYMSLSLERQKMEYQTALAAKNAESGRILEVIKVGSNDRAAEGIKFLLQTSLISDSKTARGLIEYLNNREAGEGFSLPSSAGTDASSQKSAPIEVGAGAKLSDEEVKILLGRYGRDRLDGEWPGLVVLPGIMAPMRNGK